MVIYIALMAKPRRVKSVDFSEIVSVQVECTKFD